MKLNEGPSYMVNVYYDILDDFECLWTIYRFTTKEIAEEFVTKVPFVCSDVEYDERIREDDGHLDTHPYRPIFDSLEDAIADAKQFHEYGDDKEYKYSGRVFRENLSVIEEQYKNNKIRDLSKENEELKLKIKQLEIELQSLNSN